MKQALIIFFFSLLLTSCKKSSENDDGYYSVKGIVIDWDSKTPISGAKVYSGFFGYFSVPTDSAVSDANGQVNFMFKKEGNPKILVGAKWDYIPPTTYFMPTGFVDRIDTVYLAKPSFINLTTHKTGTYQPLDSIDLQIMGIYIPTILHHSTGLDPFMRDKADAADKLFNLQSVYNLATNTSNNNSKAFYPLCKKVYFKLDIIRNGNIISTQIDSTDLIQFNTKDFTLNY